MEEVIVHVPVTVFPVVIPCYGSSPYGPFGGTTLGSPSSLGNQAWLDMPNEDRILAPLLSPGDLPDFLTNSWSLNDYKFDVPIE